MINEAVLKQKNVYDYIVDRHGTENEYAKDMSNYVVNDTFKAYNSLALIFRYIVQERQSLAGLKLFTSVLYNTKTFRECFQDTSIRQIVYSDSNVNYFLSKTIEVLNYYLTSSATPNIVFSVQNNNTILSQIALNSLSPLTNTTEFYSQLCSFFKFKLKNDGSGNLYIQTDTGRYYFVFEKNHFEVYDSDGVILFCVNTECLYLCYIFV